VNIDICMAVYGQLPYTEQFIDCAERYTKIEHRYFIIDDCSKDKTWEFLTKNAEADDRFVVERNEENIGYLLSINKALAKTTADYICITNNDVLMSKDCLEGVISAMEHEGAWAVSPVMFVGKHLFDPDKSWYQFVEERQAMMTNDMVVSGRLFGCCFVISRKCYEELGGFDEGYAPYWFEDNDYIMKLIQAEHPPLITYRGFVYHYESKTLEKLKVQTRWKLWSANKKRFEEKWGVTWNPLMFGG